MTFKYELETDVVVLSPLTALAIARGLGVPQHGAQLDDAYWFAQNFRMTRNEKNMRFWFVDAEFSPPPEGEDDEQQVENPLSRPAVYDVQYVEQEYVIQQARNVEDLPGALGRPPNTLGPIINAAFCRPDEPHVDTTRNAVIVIEKNYATLGAIMALNEDYQLTTNSDTCIVGGRSIAARRLKFLGCFSGGRQQEGDVVYYPGRTEIELKKTTDLKLDNTSYDYIPAGTVDVVKATDKNGDFVGEPINLQLDGDLSGPFGKGAGTQITWRYLEEVAYAGFFS